MNQHDRSSRAPPGRFSAPGQGWFDGIARNLVLSAARRAPSALSERLREEWLADLTARSGALSQLGFALGCRWATTVIAHEFGAPVQAAAAAVVNKTSVVHHAVVHHTGFGPAFSRRTAVILLIIGLHVLMIYVLATAIVAPRFKATSPPGIEFSLLPKPPPPASPTPVNPTIESIRVNPPMPPGPVIPPEHPDATGNSITPGPPIQSAGPPLPTPVTRVWGGPGAGFPNTDDFYPEAARRIGEKGTATVNVCVDGTGRLIGMPTIAQSSGSARLDQGALKLANAGSGHYRATTDDGRPVSACYPYRVRFQLKD